MHPAYKRNAPTDSSGDALLIIDPQVDFHTGSLQIQAAAGDAKRIANLLDRHAFSEVYVTLDTHQRYHIAHGMFWRDKNGNAPSPFTEVTPEDLKAGRWVPVKSDKKTKDWCTFYLDALRAGGKVLTIWPEHCLVGSPGGCVVPVIDEALARWERKHKSTVTYIRKGCNSLTEHYSAMKAEVPHPEDPSTELNTALLAKLKTHRSVYICGQALSHCVGTTTQDLADNWGNRGLDKLVVVEDCTSSVPGFEKQGQEFLARFRERGLTLARAPAEARGGGFAKLVCPIW